MDYKTVEVKYIIGKPDKDIKIADVKEAIENAIEKLRTEGFIIKEGGFHLNS